VFQAPTRPPGTARRRAARPRLQVEPLEDRTLPSFSAPLGYATGTTPGAVVTADFNGDGRLDLAVADQSAGVSVLLNTGDWRSFQVSGFPSPTTAGQAHPFTVTALDNNFNPLPGYTGTVHFTSSDPQAVLPADYTFTAADHGTHTFSATLKTAVGQAISVSDAAAGLTGAESGIAVRPAAVSTLLLGGFPWSVTTGDSGYFSVSAADEYGNVVTDYARTVHFTSSDGQAVLPADYTFTPASDYGTGHFRTTLRTVGTQSLTVTDLANPGLTATLSGIRVLPSVTVSGPDHALRNQILRFTLGASGGTSYRYDIDWNNDGVVDQTVTGPSGTTVDHSYAAGGSYSARVTATVNVGGADYTNFSAYKSVTVLAVSATVQNDPGDATRKALVVEGTANAETIVLSPGTANGIAVSVNGTRWDPSPPPAELPSPISSCTATAGLTPSGWPGTWPCRRCSSAATATTPSTPPAASPTTCWSAGRATTRSSAAVAGTS
jgi:hypothetical protein